MGTLLQGYLMRYGQRGTIISQTPQNVNKTLRFSRAYLAEFERRSKDPSLPTVEVGPNGEYVYYGGTDWINELYKKKSAIVIRAI